MARFAGACLVVCVLGGMCVSGASAADAPNQDLSSFHFGVGLSLTYSKNQDRVKDAQVINGLVRVTEEDNVLARVLLETHHFFQVNGKTGYGLFIGLQPGSDHAIEAIGLGLLVGQKNQDNSSWNIGLGYIVDLHAKVLGDGIQRDQPLPAGETAIRFKETDKGGYLVFASFTW